VHITHSHINMALVSPALPHPLYLLILPVHLIGHPSAVSRLSLSNSTSKSKLLNPMRRDLISTAQIVRKGVVVMTSYHAIIMRLSPTVCFVQPSNMPC
jgi:hypothetical protein